MNEKYNYQKLTCFKSYDIRGKLGKELNEKIAYRIGRAYGVWLSDGKEKTVVLGSDIRHTSNNLKGHIAKGLMDEGINVIDLGLTGTEEVYFATYHFDVDGGIEITASHNPIDYNGMKLVRSGAKPISGDTGLKDIQMIAEKGKFSSVGMRGHMMQKSCLGDYISHLLSYISHENIHPLKLVVNAGNGVAGHIIDAIEAKFKHLHIPITFIKINHLADGDFPNGIPNPLLPECREDTINAVIEHHADIGIAWDGDFDRCFFFDEKGCFIEGYYIVGLLAEAFLHKKENEKVIHDPRLIWNTVDIVQRNKGQAIQCKTGHSFIKECMREEDAIYGGEMSGHHYFRDFAYCDSGMIPWLLVVELISNKKKTLSSLLDERISKFPCSGEINFKVENANVALECVQRHYLNSLTYDAKPEFDFTDGVSISFKEWRFNLRSSNTEHIMRLNVESKGDLKLMQQCVTEISRLIEGKEI